jgi:hypothetical protein
MTRIPVDVFLSICILTVYSQATISSELLFQHYITHIWLELKLKYSTVERGPSSFEKPDPEMQKDPLVRAGLSDPLAALGFPTAVSKGGLLGQTGLIEAEAIVQVGFI